MTFRDLINGQNHSLKENEIKFEALSVMKDIHSALADLSFVGVIAKMRPENPLKKDVTALEKELNELTNKVGQFVTDNLSDATDVEQGDIEDAEVEKEVKKSGAAAEEKNPEENK